MPTRHQHSRFPLRSSSLSQLNSSIICPIGRQVPCNDNLSMLTILIFVVPLSGSRASAHPATAQQRNHLQRETLYALHRSPNAVGNFRMHSWMIEDSPISQTNTIICSTASMEGHFFESYAIRCQTSIVPLTLALTIPSSQRRMKTFCGRRSMCHTFIPINRRKSTTSSVNFGPCSTSGASSYQ